MQLFSAYSQRQLVMLHSKLHSRIKFRWEESQQHKRVRKYYYTMEAITATLDMDSGRSTIPREERIMNNGDFGKDKSKKVSSSNKITHSKANTQSFSMRNKQNGLKLSLSE